jgi:hypothetical protein
MSQEDLRILDTIRDVMETDQSFFSMSRYLDGRTRANLIAVQLRNTNIALNTIRDISSRRRTTTIVANIPIGALDISGNFFDPVVVRPTQAEITAAVEHHIQVPEDTTCSICQDELSCATRIRHCGHTFHSSCINEWFSMNPRCPVCRHDIRLQTAPSTITNETSSMHSDEE